MASIEEMETEIRVLEEVENLSVKDLIKAIKDKKKKLKKQLKFLKTRDGEWYEK